MDKIQKYVKGAEQVNIPIGYCFLLFTFYFLL